MHRQRRFLLSLIFVAAATTTTAVGQTGRVDDAPAGSILSAVAIPDFSGIWAHSSWPGFEPPRSGPGPVTNRSRRNGVSSPTGFVGDYTNPILKPQTAELVRARGEMESVGVAQPNPATQCWPAGVPFIFWNFGMQMLQRPNQVTFLYVWDNEVRRVRMNEAHPAKLTPSWYGDSVGHYEGDTLVIDTVGIKTDRPFAMVDMFGTPYSGALHVVERYRLLDYEAAKEGLERDAKENQRLGPNTGTPFADDRNYKGKHLQLEFTVSDGGVFTTPWSATITYRRPLKNEWPEMVCSENQRAFYTGGQAAIPVAGRPDF
jgi:hypothetical protein